MKKILVSRKSGISIYADINAANNKLGPYHIKHSHQGDKGDNTFSSLLDAEKKQTTLVGIYSK